MCTVVINPYGMVAGVYNGTTANAAFPFISVSSSNTSLVYNGATISAGPFNSQLANM